MYYLGRIMMLASLLFIVPLAVSLLYRDGCFFAILFPAVGMFVTGLIGSRFKPKDRRSYAREGFVIVTAMWLLFSVCGGVSHPSSSRK